MHQKQVECRQNALKRHHKDINQIMNKIILPYPLSINNYYNTVGKSRVLSKYGRKFKENAKILNCKIKPTANNYKLDIIINPKSKKNGEASKVLIDIDNGLKCILDSLHDIVYFDDKQVKDLRVRYGEPIKDGGTIIYYEII